MPKPPAFPTLRETELGIKDGPVDGATLRDVLKRFFAQTNPGLDATNKSLSKGLNPAEHFRCDILTAKATHGVAFTVRLRTLTKAATCLVTGGDTALPWPVASVQMLQPSQSGGVPTAQVTVYFAISTATANVRLWLFEDGQQATSAAVFSPLMLSTGSIVPVAVAATSCADQTFTVAGLATTDRLSAVSPPSALGNVSVHGYVSAANTLLLHFTNPTAGAITPPAGAYTFAAFR